MDQITGEERRRIAEPVAEGAPPWKLHQEINRSRQGELVYANRGLVSGDQRNTPS